MATHIINYLTDIDTLSVHQFDFRAAHSIVDQLLATYNGITLLIDEGKVVDHVFFDISKGFDMACFWAFIRKLYNIDIQDNNLAWVNVFLSDCSMRVRVAGVFSSPVPVNSGVPQGSEHLYTMTMVRTPRAARLI